MGDHSRWHTATEDTDTHTPALLLHTPAASASLAPCVSRTSSSRKKISLVHAVSCTETSELPRLLRLRQRRSSSRTNVRLSSALQRLPSNPAEQQLRSRSMLVPWR